MIGGSKGQMSSCAIGRIQQHLSCLFNSLRWLANNSYVSAATSSIVVSVTSVAALVGMSTDDYGAVLPLLIGTDAGPEATWKGRTVGRDINKCAEKLEARKLQPYKTRIQKDSDHSAYLACS